MAEKIRRDEWWEFKIGMIAVLSTVYTNYCPASRRELDAREN